MKSATTFENTSETYFKLTSKATVAPTKHNTSKKDFMLPRM